jgi:hypothetical protein
MLETLMKRPAVTLGVLAMIGIVIVAAVLLIVLSDNEAAEDDDDRGTTVTTEGPFITVESVETNAEVGVAQPVKVRVEDAQGVSALEVLLADQTVWNPTVIRGQKTVFTTYPWIPEDTGDFMFTIRAETIDGREAVKNIQLSAGCCPPEGNVNIGYTVKEGDDLAAIANGFGVCLDELREANPDVENIMPGDVLEIPYRPISERNAGNIDQEEDCKPVTPDVFVNFERRDSAFPTEGGTISRGFGCAQFFTGYRGTNCPDDMPWFHTGIDVAIEEGSPITTVDAGTVIHVGPDVTSRADCSNVNGSKAPHNGYGNHIRIEDGDMLFLYAHLSGWIASQGQTYDGSGFLLGYIGTTGCSTGPHLHLEVRRGGVAMDPLVYINQVEAAAGE